MKNDERSKKHKLSSVDPATGQRVAVYDGHSVEEALAIAAKVRTAFEGWRRRPIEERALPVKRVAESLRRRKREYAELMTAEMGKIIADGEAEVEKCASNCDFFSEKAAAFLAREPADIGAHKTFVTFNPLGVVLAVMPWNFPFWQMIRFAAPALMAGNAVVLKHASNVSGCALALENLFKEAGFPDDLVRTVLIPGAQVKELIECDAIAAVTLTGSVAAGRQVATTAAGVLKKCVLELGGSDAYLVLEDADIEKAARVCAAARMVNAGQSCIAGKRFIVVSKVRDQFERAFAAAMSGYQMGDPRQSGTKLGPLQSVLARDEVHQQVLDSLARGARLVTGGVIPDRLGGWYPATVLADVRPGMPAHDDEIFGPVAAIIEARDEDDAVEIANKSEFGLGSGVLTRDLARGEFIAANRLEAGMSFVNASVRSDPRMPFGGVKHSGYGRECSRYGILEFTNIKTVLVEP